MNIFETLQSLNISESCLNDILALIESNLISAEEVDRRRNQKIIYDNITKLRNMHMSGRLNKVRQTGGGNMIGDPETVKELENMKKQSQDAQKKLGIQQPKSQPKPNLKVVK